MNKTILLLGIFLFAFIAIALSVKYYQDEQLKLDIKSVKSQLQIITRKMKSIDENNILSIDEIGKSFAQNDLTDLWGNKIRLVKTSYEDRSDYFAISDGPDKLIESDDDIFAQETNFQTSKIGR